MEITVFRIAIAVVFLMQILLTALVKKTWIKWMPAITLALLMALCILGYGLSGWTNWGYLILLFGLAVLLAGDGVAAVFGVLIRRLFRKK